MGTITDALALANRVLDRPHADPDDDLATMARGVVLMHEYATRPAREDLLQAASHILNTFIRDEEQGYRSRDRQFVIEILGRAIGKQPGAAS